MSLSLHFLHLAFKQIQFIAQLFVDVSLLLEILFQLLLLTIRALFHDFDLGFAVNQFLL